MRLVKKYSGIPLVLCVTLFMFAVTYSLIQTRTLEEQIQQSRVMSCLAQNSHNANAFAVIKKLAAKEALHASAKAKAQLQHDLGTYKVLFQALAPVKNCQQTNRLGKT